MNQHIPPHGDQPNLPGRTECAVLVFIMGVAVALRFHHLDEPYFWFDEFLIVHWANNTFENVFRFLKAHPDLPYFPLLTKLVMSVGKSSAVLRFVPALAGTAAVYLAYRGARALFGRDVALMTAALFASNAFLFWMSRQLRCYMLLNLFILGSLLALIAFVNDPSRRNFWRLAAVNAVMLLLHRLAGFIVATEMLVVGMCWLWPGSRVSWRDVGRFLAATAVSLLPVYLVPMNEGAKGYFALNIPSPLEVLKVAWEVSALVLDMLETPFSRAVLGLMALTGAAVLWQRDRKLLAIYAVFVLTPFAMIAMVNTSPSPHSYLYALFPLFSLAALGVVRLLKKPLLTAAFAVVLCAVTAVYVFGWRYDDFYNLDSERFNGWHTENSKVIARSLTKYVQPGDAAMFSSMALYYQLNWYLDQYFRLNPVTSQSVSPDRKSVDLKYLASYDFSPEFPDEASRAAFKSAILGKGRIDRVDVYGMRIASEPVTQVRQTPFELRLTADPTNFYRHVSCAQGVMPIPYFGFRLIPTRNDETSWLEHALENAEGVSPEHISLVFSYLNGGDGNIVRLQYRFDDGPFVTALSSAGPDPVRRHRFYIQRTEPYKRVTLRVEMVCSRRSPMYIGGNLESVAFTGLSVYACSSADYPFCAYAQQMEAGESGFLEGGGVAQQETSRENLSAAPALEAPGWTVLSVADKQRPGELSVLAGPAPGGLTFYPRMAGSQSSVVVDALNPDGSRLREVFRHTGIPEKWTPVAMRFVFPLAEAARSSVPLRIVLSGGAQLWVKGKDVFFHAGK